MSRINKDTGLLFPENSNLALLQSVRDRLMTRIGSRPTRPEYGSLVGRTSPTSIEFENSVRAALASDKGITSLDIVSERGILTLIVNYNLRVVL